MTDITIAAGGFPHYEGTTDVELWIVANKPFVTPDGKAISQTSVKEATWMIRKTLSVDGNKVLQVPQVVIDATEDASVNPDATLSAFVVTPQGRPISVLSVFKNFVVPATSANTTWKDLARYQLPLEAPSGLIAVAISSTAIDLGWTDVLDATGYKIERRTGAGAFAEVGAVAQGIGVFHDTGRSPLTQYDYRIRAYRGTKHSAYSDNKSATTQAPPLPIAPSISAETVEKLRIAVTINASANSDSYKLYRGTVSGGPYTEIATGLAAGVYNDAGRTEGVTYYYVAKGHNAAGDSGNSNQASAIAENIVDPLNVPNLLVAIDTENVAGAESDNIALVVDQSGNGNSATVVGTAKLRVNSPLINNRKYLEFQNIASWMNLATNMPNVRYVVMVMRDRVIPNIPGSNESLFSSNAALEPGAKGPGDSHFNTDLLNRQQGTFPTSNTSTQIINAAAKVRVNGFEVPFGPRQAPTYTPGGTSYYPSVLMPYLSRPQGFTILEFETAGNLPVDTIFSLTRTPNAGRASDFVAFYAYSTIPDATTKDGVRAKIRSRYGLNNPIPQVICLGDSLTYGAGEAANNGYLTLVPKLGAALKDLGLPCDMLNLGQGSEDVGDNTIDGTIAYMYHNYWKQLRDPNRDQVIVLWGGGNDIGHGRTVSQIETGLQALCNEIRADGFKLVLIPVAPSRFNGANASNYDVYRDPLNAWEVANHATLADAFVEDYITNPMIGVNMAFADHPELFSDGVHINRSGYDILVQLTSPKVFSALGLPEPTIPAAPVMNAPVVNLSDVHLTAANVPGASTYKLYRATDPAGPFTTLLFEQMSGGTFSYHDTTGTPGTTYYYALRAHNSLGDSVLSNVVNATSATLPYEDPTSVSGLQGWWRPQTESFANDSLVTSEPTAGGPAVNATSANNNQRPTFKTNAINGKSALLFGLITNSELPNLSAATGPNSTARTIFAVIQPNALANMAILGFSDVADTAVVMLRSDGLIWCRNKTGTTQTSGTGNTYAINEKMIIEAVIQKSGQMDVYKQGQQILSYNSGAATWGTGFRITEAATAFKGYMGDRIVYDGAISASERQSIRTELAEFYGITLPWEPEYSRAGLLR